MFFWLFLCLHHVSGQTVVEGFVGGSVILPCSLTPNGDLSWKQDRNGILVKPAGGQVVVDVKYKGEVSLVNGDDLRISLLNRTRDGDGGAGDRIFVCAYTGGGGSQHIQLRLLVVIAGVNILETSGGPITVTEGKSTKLTCYVTGEPNPPPSYSWSVDDGSASVQASGSYTFTPDKTMKTIKCTATNRYSSGTLLSEKEATAKLNVQYLDPPVLQTSVTFTENNKVTLQCPVQGNPALSYEWRLSGSSDVRSTSADYTIDNVHRSAAGMYTCNYTNTLGSNSITTVLIVQYPPDVMVSYDKTSQILTCRAEGVPEDYSFSQWEHRLDGKLLQTLGKPIFKLHESLTFEDTGYYVCQVSNGIKSPQSGQMFVTPPTAAIFEDQNPGRNTVIDGKTGTVSVPFYTYSDTPNVKVVWKQSGGSTVLTSHREETGPVKLMIHGQSVGIDGTVTILTLRDATESDEGNYTVTVTNDINGTPRSNQITIVVSVVKPDSQRSNRLAPVVGGVAGGIVLVIIVIIVIIVLIKRRKSIKSKHTGKAGRDKKPSAPKQKKVTNAKLPKKGGLNYQDVEFANAGEKSIVHPREDPVTYADIRFTTGESTADNPASKNIGGSEEKASPKKGGLNYQDVELANAGEKSIVHPREDPVTYADIRFITGESTADDPAKKNIGGTEEKASPKNAKKPGLSYEQVEFNKTKESATIPSRQDPVTYADISFVKKAQV